jgi:glycosyltransferase involved in cell wall biosynthesis
VVRPIDVLILIDGLSVGGTERQVLTLLRGLERTGRCRTILGVVDRGGPFEAEAASLARHVLPLSRRHRIDPGFVPALIRQARGAGVELIHAFGWMSGLAGLLAARRLRIPIINSSIRAACPQLELRDRISRWCAQRSDLIVANSRAGLASYGFAGRINARVVYNGIDPERFTSVVAAASADLCMVANFSRYKDHATLLRALALLRDAGSSATLRLLGRDVGTLDASLRLIAELSLQDRVQIVADSFDPAAHIAGARLCILTSTQGEGFANAVLEYMAAGKAVVVTDVGGNRELVDEGIEGLRVPARDPAALAAALARLLDRPDLAARMGAAGRDRVARDFTVDRMVTAYEQLYRTLRQRQMEEPIASVASSRRES